MVYTDYFVRGAEPVQTCAVHSAAALPYPEPYFAAGTIDTLGDTLSAGTVGTASDMPAPDSVPPPAAREPSAAAPREPLSASPPDQPATDLPPAPPEAPPASPTR
jgi:hypothetical protein